MSGGKFTFKYEDEHGLNITYEVADAVTVTDVLDNVANFMRAIGYQISNLEDVSEEDTGFSPNSVFVTTNFDRQLFGDHPDFETPTEE